MGGWGGGEVGLLRLLAFNEQDKGQRSLGKQQLHFNPLTCISYHH